MCVSPWRSPREWSLTRRLGRTPCPAAVCLKAQTMASLSTIVGLVQGVLLVGGWFQNKCRLQIQIPQLLFSTHVWPLIQRETIGLCSLRGPNPIVCHNARAGILLPIATVSHHGSPACKSVLSLPCDLTCPNKIIFFSKDSVERFSLDKQFKIFSLACSLPKYSE